MFDFFLRNSRGAVTVMVTVLLIPAVLLSGTFVDLARVYAMRAELENASLLAGNSVLAEYNNLMKDMYGLYAFLKEENDPVLNDLICDYIEASLSGDSGPTRLSNSFIYPGAKNLKVMKAAPSGNLTEAKVLKNQIEEYMKYRAPVIVVTKIIDMFSDENNNDPIVQDMKAVKKLKAEGKVFEQYEAVLNLTRDFCDTANQTMVKMGGSVQVVDDWFKNMQDLEKELIELKKIYDKVETDDEGKKKQSDDYDKQYKKVEQAYNLIESSSKKGIKNYLFSGKNAFAHALDSANSLNTKYKELGDAISGLGGLIKKYEKELNTAGFSENSKVKAEKEKLLKIVKDVYIDLNNYVNSKNAKAIFKSLVSNTKSWSKYSESLFIKEELGKYRYKDLMGMADIEFSKIKTLKDINDKDKIILKLPTEKSDIYQTMASMSDSDLHEHWYKYYQHRLPYTESLISVQNFYNTLSSKVDQSAEIEVAPMPGTSGDKASNTKEAEKKQKGNIYEFAKKFLKIWKSCFINDEGVNKKAPKDVGLSGGNTDDDSKPESLLKKILNIIKGDTNFTDVFDVGKMAGAFADYGLQMTYITSMFSNYTTGKNYEENKTEIVKSLTGIPMDEKVNYFFKSEWEYIYGGDKDSAKNLSKVVWTLLSVRLLYNYVVSYNVEHINTTVRAIAGIPYVGPILAELARVAFVFAESTFELGILRMGGKIIVFKTSKDWYTGPEGIVNMAQDEIDLGSIKLPDKGDKKLKMDYSQHLLLLMVLFGPKGNDLMKRTGDLIELNINNYKNGIGGKEADMMNLYNGGNVLRLREFYTAIDMESRADMRMLFLSLPIAKLFVGPGKAPLDKFPVTLKVRRSY